MMIMHLYSAYVKALSALQVSTGSTVEGLKTVRNSGSHIWNIKKNALIVKDRLQHRDH